MTLLAKRLEALKAKNSGGLTESELEKQKIDEILSTMKEYSKENEEKEAKHHEMRKQHESVMTGLKDAVLLINGRVDSLINSVHGLNLDVDLSGIDSLEGKLASLIKTVSKIENTDLSPIEKSIKNIKPVSVESLENKVDDVLFSIVKLDEKKTDEVDLSPIVEAMNQPKVVEFKVITNSHGFPTKVITTEQ